MRCDIPSAGYQYTFEDNSQWSQFYSGGAEIKQYVKAVAKKYGTDRYIKLRHKVKDAKWNEEDGKWQFTIENLATGEVNSAFFL